MVAVLVLLKRQWCPLSALSALLAATAGSHACMSVLAGWLAGFLLLIASCLGQAQLSWSDVSSGLPAGFVINNFVSRANDAFAAVKSPAGVHILSSVSNTWSQYAPAVNKYGIGNLVVGPDNRLYCIHQGGLHVLSETATPRAWIRLAPGLRNAVTLTAGVSSKLYIHANGTTNPVILEYDTIAGTTRDLQFPAKGLDGGYCQADIQCTAFICYFDSSTDYP